MAKYHKNGELSPLTWQLKKHKLSHTDLCTMLNISLPTLRTWIQSPGIIQLKHLVSISGLLSMPVEELVYLLIRNKPNLEPQKSDPVCKLYIADIR